MRPGAVKEPAPGEADAVDQQAGLVAGPDAAAGGRELLQSGGPAGGPQELIHVGQHAGQVSELLRLVIAGHDPVLTVRAGDDAGRQAVRLFRVAGPVVSAVPVAELNPAQAEVPGCAEYVSSATAAPGRPPGRRPGGGRWTAGPGPAVAGQRRRAERGVDGGGPGQGGELDRLGHLPADPGRARRGGLGQPGHRAGAERQERFPSSAVAALTRGRRGVPSGCCGVVRVVRQVDPRGPRCRQPVPGDLGQARQARPRPTPAPRQHAQVRDDDQLIAVGAGARLPAPTRPGRVEVADAAGPDGLVGAHHPGGAQRRGMQDIRQPVPPRPRW